MGEQGGLRQSLGCLQREETCFRSCSELLCPSKLSEMLTWASALLHVEPPSAPAPKLASQLLLCGGLVLWRVVCTFLLSLAGSHDTPTPSPHHVLVTLSKLHCHNICRDYSSLCLTMDSNPLASTSPQTVPA